MFRFRVRKNPDPLLKFTQKAVLFQDISIFFVLKTELYLSSGTYFFFWKLVFHFTVREKKVKKVEKQVNMSKDFRHEKNHVSYNYLIAKPGTR